MLNGTIDLHLHTNCSDGLDTPEELVRTFALEGFTTISITDHDTVAGLERGMKAAVGSPLEVVPGIELSSMDKDDDIHILGYFIDYKDPVFLEKISFFMEKRRERADEIVKCLNRIGLDINIDSVLKIAHGAAIGRPHIAEALLSEKLIDFYDEAFIRYLGTNCPAYVPKHKISPREAIQIILDNGGIPVIAHPYAYRRDEIIHDLVGDGLMGIEAVHPLHTPVIQDRYKKIALQYGLWVTGGSDWHGKSRRRNYRNIVDSSLVTEQTLAEMKLYHAKSIRRSGDKQAGLNE